MAAWTVKPYRCLSLHLFYCSWNEWVTIPILIKDIPRTAQLAMTVYDIYGPGKAVPVGGTTVSLFGKRGLVYLYKAVFRACSCRSTDSSVGRAVDCRGVVIHRSLVRIRLGGLFSTFFSPISCLHRGFHDLKVWRDTVADGSADSATPGKLKNEDSEMARLRKVRNIIDCTVLQLHNFCGENGFAQFVVVFAIITVGEEV